MRCAGGVLEWRLDPKSDEHIPEATDLAGGVEAWLEAGFPMAIDLADVRL